MLNMNGSSNENQTNGVGGGATVVGSIGGGVGGGGIGVGTVPSLYDFYKIPVVVDGVGKGITLITSDGKTVTDASALQEMVWR